MSISTDFGGYADLSEILGVPVTSVRTYQARAARNRRNGAATGKDLPAPIKTIGNSPVWDLAQVKDWDKGRRRTAAWKARNQGVDSR